MLVHRICVDGELYGEIPAVTARSNCCQERRMWLHDTICHRQHSEYHSLVQQMLLDKAQFQAYFRSFCLCLFSLKLEQVSPSEICCSRKAGIFKFPLLLFCSIILCLFPFPTHKYFLAIFTFKALRGQQALINMGNRNFV